MAEITDRLLNRMNALFDVVQNLTPTSSDQEFNSFGSFFAEDCQVSLKCLNPHRTPGVTRLGAIEDMKNTLESIRILGWVPVKHSVSADGRTLFCETRQRLDVMGEILDPFFETQVVTFNDQDLIQELTLYSCWSPIVRIVQDKTGQGPYSEGEARIAWDTLGETEAKARQQRLEELRKAVCC